MMIRFPFVLLFCSIAVGISNFTCYLCLVKLNPDSDDRSVNANIHKAQSADIGEQVGIA